MGGGLLVRRLLFGVGIVAILMLVGSGAPLQAQDSIQILSDEVDIRYPYLVNFSMEARSGAAAIRDVRLVWQAGPEDAFNVTRMNFRPGQAVAIQFPLNVQFLRLPPFAQISYRWELRDEDGNQLTTENRTFEYEDTRNDWQVLENERIRMLWYDLDSALAADLFEVSDDAYQRLAADFGVELVSRPTVIIYPDQRAFTEFQTMMNNVEFVVGRYFPGHNITVNLVTEEMDRELIMDTLAHELSHLYSDNYYVGVARLPLWLEEGLATFNEGEDLSEELRQVQMAAASGDLVPFIDLPVAIRDSNIYITNLAYSEGATIFAYIHERWGQAAVADFLGAFRRTTNVGDVTLNIFGQTLPEFEMGWRAWLGYPVDRVPELIATPTLRALTFPTPTYGVPSN